MSRLHEFGARHGLVGLTATILVAWAAWWVRRRRAGERLADAEARMEPRPVVY